MVVSTGHGDGNNKKEEALQLVVRSMRRPSHMEIFEQDFSGAKRSPHRLSESLQSARGTVGLV